MNTIPLWAQVLGAIYMGTGVFRLACHWPQARRCIVSPELAEGVSLATWTGLLACASVAFLYAVLVVRDWPLIVSTGCNVVGPLMVMGAVAGARSRTGSAAGPRFRAPRWRRSQ